MREIQPNTSFRTHKRFEFICPEHRTAEARAILQPIEGVRLVKSNPEANVETRIHLQAGVTYGIKIRGVAKNEETFGNVLESLSQSEIAGYSRRTQLIITPNSHLEVKFANENEGEILSSDDGLPKGI